MLHGLYKGKWHTETSYNRYVGYNDINSDSWSGIERALKYPLHCVDFDEDYIGDNPELIIPHVFLGGYDEKEL